MVLAKGQTLINEIKLRVQKQTVMLWTTAFQQVVREFIKKIRERIVFSIDAAGTTGYPHVKQQR